MRKGRGMDSKIIKRIVCNASAYAAILAKGFARMLFGTLTAGLFALAAYGFAMITRESGWTVVGEFVVSVSTVIIAVMCMFTMGGGVKKGAKR